MQESYREGVASHPGPQPCEGGREAALEAWERGIRRQEIELRHVQKKERKRKADVFSGR